MTELKHIIPRPSFGQVTAIAPMQTVLEPGSSSETKVYTELSDTRYGGVKVTSSNTYRETSPSGSSGRAHIKSTYKAEVGPMVIEHIIDISGGRIEEWLHVTDKTTNTVYKQTRLGNDWFRYEKEQNGTIGPLNETLFGDAIHFVDPYDQNFRAALKAGTAARERDLQYYVAQNPATGLNTPGGQPSKHAFLSTDGSCTVLRSSMSGEPYAAYCKDEKVRPPKSSPLASYTSIGRLTDLDAVTEGKVRQSLPEWLMTNLQKSGAVLYVDHIDNHRIPALQHRAKDDRTSGKPDSLPSIR